MLARLRRNWKSFLLLVFLLAAVGFGVWEFLLRPRYNFPRSEADYYVNDPLLGHRHRSHARREFEFPEHPRRRIVMRTNNLGMRMDRDVEVTKPAGTKRVLVVGDSHFDGVVYNDESFACLLERLMNTGSRSRAWEVLNVSTGYYGPDHYLKSVDAYRHLEADCWVVGFYSGNDFLDAVRGLEATGSSLPERPWSYRSKLRKADRLHAGAVAQMLNQAYYFRSFPEMRGIVLDRVEGLFREMHRKAAGDHALLAVILIPTKWDVEPAAMPAEFQEAVRELDLKEEDLQILPELRLDLQRRLSTAGIWCLDPTEEMRQRNPPFYWQQDFHLNVAGHALLAELAAPEILRRLAR